MLEQSEARASVHSNPGHVWLVSPPIVQCCPFRFGHPLKSMLCISGDVKHPGWQHCWRHAPFTGRLHAHLSAQSIMAAQQLSGLPVLYRDAVTFTHQAVLVLMNDRILIKGARAFVEGAGLAGQRASHLLPADCLHTSLP